MTARKYRKNCANSYSAVNMVDSNKQWIGLWDCEVRFCIHWFQFVARFQLKNVKRNEFNLFVIFLRSMHMKKKTSIESGKSLAISWKSSVLFFPSSFDWGKMCIDLLEMHFEFDVKYLRLQSIAMSVSWLVKLTELVLTYVNIRTKKRIHTLGR